MGIISDKIDAQITAIKSGFAVNKNVRHQGIKGGLNEEEVSSLIEKIIPKKYKIAKGIIENCSGKQSSETDIFIYDDEILPPYIKNNLTFLPVEAVKYIFEIKSLLNSSEIKTTIEKFEKFKLIGGRSPAVLFSFSSDILGSELVRYRKYDSSFFTKPAATVLCVSEKGYYFKSATEHYLKDHLSISEFIRKTNEAKGINIEEAKNALNEFMKNNEHLQKLSRAEFALLLKSSIQFQELTANLDEKKLMVNGVNYSEIKFTVHKWLGIESKSNDIELSFLSGVSNTLSKDNFGKYLLDGKKLDFKVFAVCYEDMWGNKSCEDFNENGLSYDPDQVSFTFKSSNDSNKLLFQIRNDPIVAKN